MTTAFAWVLALLDEVGSQPRGKRVRQCVSHEDAKPSLSIVPHEEGSWAPRCFGGCSTQQVLDALHLTRYRMFRPPPVSPAEYVRQVGLKVEFPPLDPDAGRHPATRGMRLEAVHDYGVAVLERWRARNGSKDLRWERVLPSGARIPGLGHLTLASMPLYQERAALQAVGLNEPVLVTESESSVDSLKGWFGVTWAGSAWTVQTGRLSRILGGYPNVIVIPDHDQAGLAALAQLERAGLARHILMPEPGEDARDLLKRLGHHRFADAVRGVLARAPVAA
ncbi:hypothetical protein RB614_37695 [Phytohabitans sp. ZYX-F-186]|uniref:Toprim domain-containing protein n=1 Tax=Phytohabitans maris TaxID=3071409 RepID=A0ABU0ZT76_9ACTN|nr:hypothetical protein [Phytohabitans sp. ZYX-F-186]MDQ7910243.1 hypothetical protein [Phytohabitans sp. ZYX-F-186]